VKYSNCTIVSSQWGYDSGGMLLVGRTWVAGSENYEFGYQGSMKDDEIYGNGNAYSTHFRELDPRLMRWWSNDPKTNQTPWESHYVSMGNNPIWNNDIIGDSPEKRIARKIDRAENKMSKAGILNTNQRAQLISMMISQTRMYKKGKLDTFSNFDDRNSNNQNNSGEDSKMTGGEFTQTELPGLPNLNVTTLFRSNSGIPVNPATLAADVTPLANLLNNNNGLQINIIGVTNSTVLGVLIPPNGIALGRAKAQTVANALINQGVNPNQINNIGGTLPGFRLIARVWGANANLNRRVIIQLPSAKAIIRQTRQSLSRVQVINNKQIQMEEDNRLGK